MTVVEFCNCVKNPGDLLTLACEEEVASEHSDEFFQIMLSALSQHELRISTEELSRDSVIRPQQTNHTLILQMTGLLDNLGILLNETLLHICIAGSIHTLEYLLRTFVHFCEQLEVLLPFQLIKFPLRIIPMNPF
jgi:hypothetical protein